MSELTIISAVSLVGGVILGYFMTRVALREIGLTPDERAMEIDKLAALRTLELTLLVDVVLLFYNLLIPGNQAAVNTALMILTAIFFGSWFFRWYYARRM